MVTSVPVVAGTMVRLPPAPLTPPPKLRLSTVITVLPVTEVAPAKVSASVPGSKVRSPLRMVNGAFTVSEVPGVAVTVLPKRVAPVVLMVVSPPLVRLSGP